MKRKCAACLLFFLLLFSFTACQSAENTQDAAQDVQIAIQNQCASDIYGITVEYSVNRTRLGGQSITKNPGTTRKLPSEEKLSFGFSEQDFPVSLTPADGPFGIFVTVLLKNGVEAPLSDFWEWTAVCGETYTFMLSGSPESGFTLTPQTDVPDCIVTPKSALPQAFVM